MAKDIISCNSSLKPKDSLSLTEFEGLTRQVWTALDYNIDPTKWYYLRISAQNKWTIGHCVPGNLLRKFNIDQPYCFFSAQSGNIGYKIFLSANYSGSKLSYYIGATVYSADDNIILWVVEL